MNSEKPFPIGLPGQWQEADAVSVPDAYLKNWLLDTGSLTERLQSHCRQFSLALLGQQPISPASAHLPDALQTHGELAWQVREVVLYGNGEPWVFAHSLIPDALCQGDLAGLGDKPLGQRIFNDERFVRSNFQLTALSIDESFLENLGIVARHPLWGRRSMFSLLEHHMMVAEIFLPAAPAYSHMQVA